MTHCGRHKAAVALPLLLVLVPVTGGTVFANLIGSARQRSGVYLWPRGAQFIPPEHEFTIRRNPLNMNSIRINTSTNHRPLTRQRIVAKTALPEAHVEVLVLYYIIIIILCFLWRIRVSMNSGAKMGFIMEKCSLQNKE